MSYKATSIIRFQLLILDLLENGKLNFNEKWNINLNSRDIKDFAEIAIKDLFIWLKNIYNLHKIDFKEPLINIKNYDDLNELNKNKIGINIDFSLFQRFTDENTNYTNTYFVRTDYFDEFKFYHKKHSNADEFVKFKKIDYFKVSTDKNIDYKLILDKSSKDEQSLLFLMWNIFLQTNDNLNLKTLTFRE